MQFCIVLKNKFDVMVGATVIDVLIFTVVLLLKSFFAGTFVNLSLWLLLFFLVLLQAQPGKSGRNHATLPISNVSVKNIGR